MAHSEFGRTMVEMIAVTALVGVLSVGGIMGYNTATRKTFVNELIDGANQRATAVTHNCF